MYNIKTFCLKKYVMLHCKQEIDRNKIYLVVYYYFHLSNKNRKKSLVQSLQFTSTLIPFP